MSKQILQFLFDMLLPLIIGYTLRRSSRDFSRIADKLILLNITVILPILTILTFWIVKLNPNYALLPLVGVLQQLIPGAIGYFVGKNKLSTYNEKGSLAISCILTNRTTMGTLAVFILLGEQAYAIAQFIVFLEIIVTFAFAFPLANYFHQRHNSQEVSKFRFNSFWNRNMIPLVGILIGLALNFSGLERPALAGSILPYFIHLNGWSALLPVGYSISFAGVKKQYKISCGLGGIKFLLTPLVTLLLLYPFYHDPLVFKAALILSFAPIAINAVIAAKIYQLDLDISVSGFVVTTLLYLAVIFPLQAISLHLF